MTQSANVNKPEEPDSHAPSRKVDEPFVESWPAGYKNGGFRLVPVGVLLFAKGKPTLRIEEGGRTSALTYA